MAEEERIQTMMTLHWSKFKDKAGSVTNNKLNYVKHEEQQKPTLNAIYGQVAVTKDQWQGPPAPTRKLTGRGGRPWPGDRWASIRLGDDFKMVEYYMVDVFS